MYRYFALHKPYGMLSQFTREGNNPSLADINFAFPKDVYPLGRLDSDSEGLLLLSNDPSLNQALLHPTHSHWRKYLAQVEGIIREEDARQIEQGVIISINGKKYKTLHCRVNLTRAPDFIQERKPPVRYRKNIPTSWVILELKEGKNRQVRKMTAAVGFPTLRLVRLAISGLDLGKLEAGEVLEFKKDLFLHKLDIVT